MTLVNIDLRNQGYETCPDDRVVFYSLLVREGDFGTISTAPVEVELVDGKASVDLAPGPVGVQIIAGQVADTRVKIGEVPPSGPTTLGAVMMVTPAYTPALQAQFLKAIQSAQTAALESIDGEVSLALSGEISDMRELAEDAAASAATVSVIASSFQGHSPQQVINARNQAESFAAASLIARDSAWSAASQSTQEALSARAERERAEAASWAASMTTVGVNVTESPRDSGIWIIGAEHITLIESPELSGLYEIGVT